MVKQQGDLIEDDLVVTSEGRKDTLYRLIGHQNRAVLLFYPSCKTADCEQIMKKIRDNMKFYNSLNTNLLAVFNDTVSRLADFKKRNNLNFYLISDIQGRLFKTFGLYGENSGDAAEKILAVIDEQNTVVDIQREKENGAKVFPDFKQLHRTLFSMSGK